MTIHGRGGVMSESINEGGDDKWEEGVTSEEVMINDRR